MLIDFRVENHRSLCDEQVLTMEVGRVGDESDLRPRHVSGNSECLLPLAALYGANASGKSNVLGALAFMCDAVLDSHRAWSPDGGVPRDPFAWGPKRGEPSLFEVTLLLGTVRYQYGFTTSDESFLEEWLFAWPLGKKQVWFERDPNTFKFGDNFKGEHKLIEEVTRSNALFLSAAVQHKNQQLQPIFSWFRRLQTVNLRRGGRTFSPSQTFSTVAWLSRMLDDEGDDDADSHEPTVAQDVAPKESLVSSFRALLRASDIGIVDLKVVKSEPDDTPQYASKYAGRIRVLLKHQCAHNAWLPLAEESKGTQTLFRMALPILQAIRDGSTLLVDELESSLHPSLAQRIVQQFNDPATNPNNAQLIFTTHDTNLLGTTLGEPVLRRDQVWMTEKDSEGATVLYPLTDYKPRKSENLERGYLQGRYSAIPFLGDFSVLGE